MLTTYKTPSLKEALNTIHTIRTENKKISFLKKGIEWFSGKNTSEENSTKSSKHNMTLGDNIHRRLF